MRADGTGRKGRPQALAEGERVPERVPEGQVEAVGERLSVGLALVHGVLLGHWLCEAVALAQALAVEEAQDLGERLAVAHWEAPAVGRGDALASALSLGGPVVDALSEALRLPRGDCEGVREGVVQGLGCREAVAWRTTMRSPR